MVVGTSRDRPTDGRDTGFWWTREGGRVDLVEGPSLFVSAISDDTTTLVGTATMSDQRFRAHRYNRVTGQYDNLGTLPGYETSRANSVSRDGRVIVGHITADRQGYELRAMVWREGQGMSTLPTGRYFESNVTAVSSDGGMGVGWVSDLDYNYPAVWSLATGVMTTLPGLAGAPRSNGEAFGMSGDGRYIVGTSNYQMTIWENGVPRALGRLDNQQTLGIGVSEDGRVVVGHNFSGRDGAAIWTVEHGFMKLSVYLRQMGLQVPEGFEISRATGVSADGRVISAYGRTGFGTIEAMVFVIPSPASVMLGVSVLLYARRRR